MAVGYMVPNMISGDCFAVITKVFAGAVYGVILGFIRLKTGNCWSTILVHGVMNFFGLVWFIV
ncbi:type II CAAX prenyl endopeptidase Rce1 family protein [Thermoclostridium stercorarium]|uniref:CPBP family glutamic-type intramembrane protease n=1 Tax=Thermoclostridium stercorarium TaxID=1510 RepID=UPI0009F18E12